MAAAHAFSSAPTFKRLAMLVIARLLEPHEVAALGLMGKAKRWAGF